jgi:hypothetical protein
MATYPHVKLIQGILITTSILQPLVGASSSSSSPASPEQYLANDYPEIGGSTYGDSAKEQFQPISHHQEIKNI